MNESLQKHTVRLQWQSQHRRQPCVSTMTKNRFSITFRTPAVSQIIKWPFCIRHGHLRHHYQSCIFPWPEARSHKSSDTEMPVRSDHLWCATASACAPEKKKQTAPIRSPINAYTKEVLCELVSTVSLVLSGTKCVGNTDIDSTAHTNQKSDKQCDEQSGGAHGTKCLVIRKTPNNGDIT